MKLDSQSYLAHYYYAAIAMRLGQLEDEDDAQIERSLRTAITLNPQFAPAYDQLGMFFAMRRKNPDEAHMLSLQAISLDPSNVAYWMNSANILMINHREEDAIKVMRNALKVANSPADVSRVEEALRRAEQYQEAKKEFQDRPRNYTAGEDQERPETVKPEHSRGNSDDKDKTPPLVLRRRTEAVSEDGAHPAAKRQPEMVLGGPRRSLVGIIRDVRCSWPAVLEFKLEGKNGTTALRADNYYKVAFSAAGFIPTGELHPCTEIKGVRARVEFVEMLGRKTPEVTAVELRK